eukprot:7281171-Ditylum_brightwellii.AAC.1
MRGFASVSVLGITADKDAYGLQILDYLVSLHSSLSLPKVAGGDVAEAGLDSFSLASASRVLAIDSLFAVTGVMKQRSSWDTWLSNGLSLYIMTMLHWVE